MKGAAMTRLQRMIRRSLAGGLVLALAAAGPAEAKGPAEATIEGAGLAGPIRLTGNDPDARLYPLVDETGLFAGVFGQSPDPTSDTPPTGDLGPELSIVWLMATDQPETETI